MTSTYDIPPGPDLFGRRVLQREAARWWWVPLIGAAVWFVIAWLMFRANYTSIVTVGVLVGVIFLIAAINEGALGNWVNADRRRRGERDGALSEDERAELVRLRKENAELAMRCDVLKRSVALWVQDAMGR